MSKVGPDGNVKSPPEESIYKSLDSFENSANLKGKFTLPLITYILITVSGGTLAVGWQIGIFNTPSQTLKSFFNQSYYDKNKEYMSDNTMTLYWSLANGLMPLGGAFGGLFTGISVEKLGHKKSMLLINLIAAVCGVIFIISKPINSYETLIIARIMGGFISGYFCGVCPLYLSEIPPQNLRGASGTVNALAMCIGNLLANILGLPNLLGGTNTWPYLVGLMLIPVAIHFVGVPFMCESPKSSAQAFEKLRGKENRELIEYEMKLMAIEKERISKQTEVSYTALFTKRPLRRAMIVSIMLQASQQFSGIIVVLFYSTEIFISIGLDKDTWAIYAAILLALVETIMHAFVVFLIDFKGRRFLLISGMIGMSTCCFILAITRIFADQASWLRIIAVIAATVYIIFYSVGPGPIPLLVTAELFDTESRGKATSIAVFLNWFFNCLVTVSFPFIDKAIKGYSFIIYGALLVGFSIFTYFKVPETKNKSIEEITQHFRDNDDERYSMQPSSNNLFQD